MDSAIIFGIIQTVITSLLIFYVQNSQKKRDLQMSKEKEDRQRAVRLEYELTRTNAAVTLAMAKAMERGKFNGEVEKFMEEFERAKKDYDEFVNKQAAKAFEKG